MPGFLALVPWIVGALTAAVGVASYTAAKKAQKAARRPNDEQRGVLVNKESNVEQIPVIYGERRVGGVRVFVSTDGTYKTVDGEREWYSGFHPDTLVYDDVTGTPTNQYLYIALVLAEGEVESITDIYVDDLPITDAKYSGLVDYNVYLGTDDQTMPDSHYLREANEFWTADHRLRGVAFLGLRFTWDEEAFSGIPDVTALVKGKKVYDPRTATTAWSDNPALCIRDYLTNTRYGKGIPTSAIDDTAIAAAADDCDESVTLYDGGGSGKLFTCNAVLDTSKSLFDNLNILLLGCRGFLPYSQGQYRLKIDGSSSSQFTFTNNEIIDGIVITGESKDEKLNRVSVKFPNPDANWQPDTAIWPPAGSTEETTFLAEDGGVLLQEDIDLDTITNYYQARDLARVLVLRSRNALTCSIKTTSEALQLEIADVISITHSTPGWVAKPFQVTQMQLNEDGTVSLNLLEYDSTIYTWEEGTEQTDYPDTNLPDPFTVGVVSNITVTETTTLGSDGTVIPTGLIEWDVSYDRLVNQYEIQYKLTSEADTEFKSIFTSVPKYEFYNAEVGVSVTIRIRAINSLNVKGAFTTATFTVNGDQTAPNAPTGLVATAGIKNIRLDWTNPSATDLKIIDVYRHTSNSSGSASKIASINGESFVDQNIADAITYYYWLKAKDYSDNASSFSGVASAAATLVTSDGIVEGAIDVAKFASGIEPVSLVTSIPGSKTTEVIYNTTTNILYRWDGSQYVEATGVTDFSQLTGNVTAAQFAATIEPVTLVTSVPVIKSTETIYNTTDNTLYRWDGSAYVSVQGATDFSELSGNVTAAQFAATIQPVTLVTSVPLTKSTETIYNTTNNTLYRWDGSSYVTVQGATDFSELTGTIDTTQIENDAITAIKIANDAVTNAKLAVDAVQGDVIAAGAITETKIAADAATNAKIAVNAIQGDVIAASAITETKIANNSISTAKIAANAVTANEIAAGSVTATKIASDSITSDKIVAGTIVATDIASNTITAANIAANTITAANIATGTITASEIATNTITASQIAAGAITASEIATGAVTTLKLDALAVTADKIASNSITTAKIAAGAVTAAEIAAGTITANEIASNTITAGQIAAGAISTSELAVGAVDTTNLADDAITAAKILDGSITATLIGDGQIITSKLDANAVTAAKIAAGTITANEIAAGTITASEIASNTITAGQIAAGAISASELAIGSVGSTAIAADAVTADKILDGSITATLISDGAIVTSKLAANAVTANEIAAGTITANEILANTITAGQIAAGAITATELAADSVSVAKLVSNTAKTYSGFQFEMGTNTLVADLQGAGIFRTGTDTSFAFGCLAAANNSIGLLSQQSYNGSNAYAGGFANSIFVGGTTHRTLGLICNNTRGGYFLNVSTGNLAELGTSSYAIDTNGDVYVDGDITATGTITPFTGMHDGLIDENMIADIGDILVDSSIAVKLNVSNTISNMVLSSSPNQATAIGIYSGVRSNDYVPVSLASPADRSDENEEFKPVLNPANESVVEGKSFAVVNALGEGQVNVCGEGGDISAGDLIVTSSIPGKGMKQGDDIIRSYTVAKARESATFSAGEVKQIACIYLCG